MRASEHKKSGPSVAVTGLQPAAHFTRKIISGSMAVTELKNGNSPSATHFSIAVAAAYPRRGNDNARRFHRSHRIRRGVTGFEGPCANGNEKNYETWIQKIPAKPAANQCAERD
jgi:hypothetical protein